jgi:hypothetical protein
LKQKRRRRRRRRRRGGRGDIGVNLNPPVIDIHFRFPILLVSSVSVSIGTYILIL